MTPQQTPTPTPIPPSPLTPVPRDRLTALGVPPDFLEGSSKYASSGLTLQDLEDRARNMNVLFWWLYGGRAAGGSK
jgi:hypothetical protein